MQKFKRLIRKAGLEEMKASLLQAQLTDFMNVQNYYQSFESIAGITKFPIFSTQDNFSGSDNEIIKHLIQSDDEVFNYLWVNNVAQFGNPTIDDNSIRQNIEVELHGSNQFMLTLKSDAEALQNTTNSEFEVVEYSGGYWDDESPRDLIIYYVKSNVPIEGNIYMNQSAKEGAKKAIERFVNERFGTDTEFTKFFFEHSNVQDIIGNVKDNLFKVDITNTSPNMTQEDIDRARNRHEEEHIEGMYSDLLKLEDPLEIAKELKNMVGMQTILEYALDNSEFEFTE